MPFRRCLYYKATKLVAFIRSQYGREHSKFCGHHSLTSRGASVMSRPAKSGDKPDSPANQGAQSDLSSADVFVRYSHKHRFWKNWLLSERLSSTGMGTIEVWSDDEIQPSADWRVEIETALTNARVVVLIVSRNFLESSFIQEDELPRILERR